jgi:hypothetical protein
MYNVSLLVTEWDNKICHSGHLQLTFEISRLLRLIMIKCFGWILNIFYCIK